MIVRLMGEGQFRVDDALLEQLSVLDDAAGAAAEAGDETELDARLDRMWTLVRESGERLADDDLTPSEAVIPPSDLTLEETRRLMAPEGFIPELPAE
jgi:PspAA-like protein